MDEVLRRRLVGASVLIAAAFVVSTLLPDAGPRSGRASDHVVTYDLRTGQPIDTAAAVKPVPPPAPKPAPAPVPVPVPSEAQPSAATAPAAPQAKPEPAVPAAMPATASAAPAKEEAPNTVTAKAAAPAPAKPATTASAPHPVLKVDETFGEKPKAAAAPAKVEWFVQIGSFESQTNAGSVLKKLYGAGLPAVIQTVPTGKKLWYRVRVGPYAAETAATKALGSARAHGFKQAKLVKLDGPAASGN